jgi:hypothetical protein
VYEESNASFPQTKGTAFVFLMNGSEYS